MKTSTIRQIAVGLFLAPALAGVIALAWYTWVAPIRFVTTGCQ